MLCGESGRIKQLAYPLGVQYASGQCDTKLEFLDVGGLVIGFTRNFQNCRVPDSTLDKQILHVRNSSGWMPEPQLPL